MADKIVGCFYFKKTDSGNLLGEFINDYNNNDKIYTESADADLKKNKNKSDFEGDYTSTWQEDDSPMIMDLKIRKKKGSDKYELTWTDKTQTVFTGDGFISDNKMVGYYKTLNI